MHLRREELPGVQDKDRPNGLSPVEMLHKSR